MVKKEVFFKTKTGKEVKFFIDTNKKKNAKKK